MHRRSDILDWAAQGRIAQDKLRNALELGGVLPTAREWEQFIDRLLLFLGAVLAAAGVIFFFAFNWDGLGRFAKFALVQAPLVISLGLVWKLGLERISGKAAVLAAALFVGALLALVGQTYQTGADTFELFAAWALAILPWVLVARFPALWILWLLLVNVAVVLYYQAFFGIFGILFGSERLLWALLGLNSVALGAWEVGARLGVSGFAERWAPRVLGLASGAAATVLAVMAMVDWKGVSGWGALGWLAWLAAVYAAYRRATTDLFMLAAGALSAIVGVTVFLGKQIGFRGDEGVFLLLGLAVIGLSAAAGYWLRSVMKEAGE